MLAIVATLPAILPTRLTTGITFLVSQLLEAGAEVEVKSFSGLLKFNKWALLVARAWV